MNWLRASFGRDSLAQASNEVSSRLQVLYQHLSQPCIDLNWCASGRSCRLTDAISYSLRTPGALLHTCCQVLACLNPLALRALLCFCAKGMIS